MKLGHQGQCSHFSLVLVHDSKHTGLLGGSHHQQISAALVHPNQLSCEDMDCAVYTVGGKIIRRERGLATRPHTSRLRKLRSLTLHTHLGLSLGNILFFLTSVVLKRSSVESDVP